VRSENRKKKGKRILRGDHGGPEKFAALREKALQQPRTKSKKLRSCDEREKNEGPKPDGGQTKEVPKRALK